MLTDRESKVLKTIVYKYTFSAEPVGSKTVAQELDMEISPATVRNTMSKLEEMGYLYQPHTSAGRVPTEMGYRYYVDSLMGECNLTEEEKRAIEREYEESHGEIKRIMEHTSSLLSLISNYVGIATTPSIHDGYFKRIELISVGANTVLSVVIMASGFVQNRLLSLDFEVPRGDLEEIARMVNERLSGLPMVEIHRLAHEPIELRQRLRLEEQHFEVATHALDVDPEIEVFLEGRANILSQPEFSSPAETRRLFRLLDRKDQLTELMFLSTRSGDVQIRIGSEVALEGMEECSIVSTNYTAGTMIGTLGVIGPKRMEYTRVVPIVRYTAAVVSRTLRGGT